MTNMEHYQSNAEYYEWLIDIWHKLPSTKPPNMEDTKTVTLSFILEILDKACYCQAVAIIKKQIEDPMVRSFDLCEIVRPKIYVGKL